GRGRRVLVGLGGAARSNPRIAGTRAMRALVDVAGEVDPIHQHDLERIPVRIGRPGRLRARVLRYYVAAFLWLELEGPRRHEGEMPPQRFVRAPVWIVRVGTEFLEFADGLDTRNAIGFRDRNVEFDPAVGAKAKCRRQPTEQAAAQPGLLPDREA